MTRRPTSLRLELRKLAGWAWNSQNNAFDAGLTIHEESITEFLLLEMTRKLKWRGTSVSMFTKAQETLNGADWELFVQTPRCRLVFRVQAKRLYQNGEYDGHDPTSGQLTRLIALAGSRIPVVLFYNHDHGKTSALFTDTRQPEFRRRSFWGCAVAGAHDIRRTKSRKLSELIRFCRPWHEIFDYGGACNVEFRDGLGRVVSRSAPTAALPTSGRIGRIDFSFGSTTSVEQGLVAPPQYLNDAIEESREEIEAQWARAAEEARSERHLKDNHLAGVAFIKVHELG